MFFFNHFIEINLLAYELCLAKIEKKKDVGYLLIFFGICISWDKYKFPKSFILFTARLKSPKSPKLHWLLRNSGWCRYKSSRQ